MGLFGAMTTAVGGLRAQAFALENVSGNIANSQTTGFKRVDTSFADLVPDSVPQLQLAGGVIARSRGTNNVQGDIQNASVDTFMAINGDGYFIVQKPSGFPDGTPVFTGVDLFSRRGDFQLDKDGYLVNGTGYYLKVLRVDGTTGNVIGSVPEVLQFSNDFLPAQATTLIEYRANLASFPRTANADADVPGSERLNPAAFSVDPTVGGTGTVVANDVPTFLAQSISGGAITVFDTVGSPANIQLRWAKLADVPVNLVGAAIADDDPAGTAASATVAGGDLTQAPFDGTTLEITIDSLTEQFALGTGQIENLADLAAAIDAAYVGVLDASVAADEITITALGNTTIFEIGGTAAAGGVLDLAGTYEPTNTDLGALGGAITFQLGSGPLASINFGAGALEVNNRLELDAALANVATTTGISASVNSSDQIVINTSSPDELQIGGTPGTLAALGITGGNYQADVEPRWELFYLESSTATGTGVAWRNAGVTYTFNASGQMTSATEVTTLNGVTINGIPIGDITINHGDAGITQFSDINGNAQVNLLRQNGYPAGNLQGISVNEKGRIIASYSNGRTLEMAEIVLASFNADNALKRLDGGAFEATSESGQAQYGASGKIIGKALEGSNTDIADEFTKLIVTQQAYAANTRIVTTSDQMLQETLNMVR